MYSAIQQQCDQLVTYFPSISSGRREILSKLAHYIQQKTAQQMPINLVYICTHNSRRSHFGQIWAAVAAAYFGIPNVETFSGGTEATAFHPNAIQALRTTGFQIVQEDQLVNPRYTVRFGDQESVTCFSKVYNDSVNPSHAFVAIMTCSDAEENCPFIPGVELRIGTTYDDPKAFDGTPQESAAYTERSTQIAVETLFVFSLIQISH